MSALKFFFTSEDPREIPKSSRDPLRFLPAWSKIAREMIPHLTTVTPSYRGFLTRMLFHKVYEEYISVFEDYLDSDGAQWSAFCKFEQLCGWVRYKSTIKTPNFPGKSRVMKAGEVSEFTVGENETFWLMPSQKGTGYWGYYHKACIGSGILKKRRESSGGYVLTDAARETFHGSPAEKVLEMYGSRFKEVFEKEVTSHKVGDFDELAKLFAERPVDRSINCPDWYEYWLNTLLTSGVSSRNGSSNNRQITFAELIKANIGNCTDPYTLWEKLTEGDATDITEHAIDVRATESVIGICEWIFDVCRLRHEQGETLDNAENWANKRDFRKWVNRLQQLPPPPDEELKKYYYIARDNSPVFQKLATVLIERHKNIMYQRGQPPWVILKENGTLDIREPANEPLPPDLGTSSNSYSSGVRWRNDYFLNSWLNIAEEIGYLPRQLNE